VAFVADAVCIEARRYRLGDAAPRRYVTIRAASRWPAGLDALEMLGVVELGSEAAQTGKVLQRSFARVKLARVVAYSTNGIDGVGAHYRELHEMTAGAVTVNWKSRFQRAARAMTRPAVISAH
jgi:hypothetical protein